jgi:hypothetical protein
VEYLAFSPHDAFATAVIRYQGALASGPAQPGIQGDLGSPVTDLNDLRLALDGTQGVENWPPRLSQQRHECLGAHAEWSTVYLIP